MKSNVSTADRITRIIIAVAIVAMYFLDVISGTTGIVLLIIAAVLALTALLNFLLGLSTNKKA
jgi:hypothetical protein